jgi:hypothetical protein
MPICQEKNYLCFKKMEASGQASKAPNCSKPRIFKTPEGHCPGQASSATSIIISQLALKQLKPFHFLDYPIFEVWSFNIL